MCASLGHCSTSHIVKSNGVDIVTSCCMLVFTQYIVDKNTMTSKGVWFYLMSVVQVLFNRYWESMFFTQRHKCPAELWELFTAYIFCCRY